VARCTLVPSRGSSRNAIRSPRQSSENLAKREVGLNPNVCKMATSTDQPATTSIRQQTSCINGAGREILGRFLYVRGGTWNPRRTEIQTTDGGRFHYRVCWLCDG